MREIKYVVGDATRAQTDNMTIICHSCNDLGLWGSGFVVPLGNKYPIAKERYSKWAKSADFNSTPFRLGEVQFVKVDPKIWVANIIGQKGVGFQKGPPVKYDALYDGFNKVAEFATTQMADVVMPRIGCGLGGGSWETVEKLISQTLLRKGISVTVCDLPIRGLTSDAPTFGY
jgi:O-acetyl-ADP-ribose deacetylase (regulator of RNase III)